MIFDTCLLENAHIKLIDGDRGKNYPKQSDFSSKGHCLFLSAKNVTKAGFDFSSCSFIGEERHRLLKAGTLEADDIVMTTRGTIGNVGYYSASIKYPVIRINSGMMIFRADKAFWNPRFLYYVLTSPIIQEQILNLTSGSAVPQLPARDLKKFELPQIPLETQNQIEQIISSICDKIVLNEKQNQTLEQIAQAIFKSWFVDFAPVKAKINALEAGGSDEDALLAAMQAISGKDKAQLTRLQTDSPEHYNQLRTTAELFPSAMQDSELGEIPEGWELPSFEGLVKAKQGKYQSKAKMAQSYSEDAPIPVWGGNGILGYTSKSTYSDPVVLLTCRGSNCGLIRYTESASWVSNNAFACTPKIGSVWFLLTYFNLSSFDDCISGSAQPQITYTALKSKELPFPVNKEVCYQFSKLVESLFQNILKNKKGNYYLEETRDALLPKLLSGELKV